MSANGKGRKLRGSIEVRPIAPVQFICQNILRMTFTEVARELGISQSAVTGYITRFNGTFPEHHRRAVNKLAWERRRIRIKPEWHDRVPFEEGVPAD